MGRVRAGDLLPEVLDYEAANQQADTRQKLFSDSLRIGTFFLALIVGGSYAPSIILFMAVASSAYNTSRATGGRGSGGTSIVIIMCFTMGCLLKKRIFEKLRIRQFFFAFIVGKEYNENALEQSE